MAAVEVGGIGSMMGDCFQGTAPHPVCSCIVGRAVGREASIVGRAVGREASGMSL